MKYFKVFNDEDNHKGFQYKDGLNTDTLPFNDNPSRDCVAGGLYFADEKHIMEFLHYGNSIREVTIPEGVKCLTLGNKYRTESLFLHPRRDLREISTWKWLIEQGVDVTSAYYNAIRWASWYGHLAVVKFLVSVGVTDVDNHAFVYASVMGHLDVVKYLVSLGSDVTAYGNSAVRQASRNGHKDVVEFLLANGASLE